MGGQVRISTVGISRIHPPTLPPPLPHARHIPHGPEGKSAQSRPRKKAQKKSPCVWFLGPPCSPQIPPREAGPLSSGALVPTTRGWQDTE